MKKEIFKKIKRKSIMLHTKNKKDVFESNYEETEKASKAIFNTLTKRRYRRAPPINEYEIKEILDNSLQKKEDIKLIVLWGGPKEKFNELDEEKKTLQNLNSLKKEVEDTSSKFGVKVKLIILFAGDIHQMLSSGRSMAETMNYFKSLHELTKNFDIRIIPLSYFYVKWFLLKKIGNVLNDTFLYKDNKLPLYTTLRKVYWNINVFLGQKIIGPSSYLSTIHNIDVTKIKEDMDNFLKRYNKEALDIAENSAKKWSVFAIDEKSTKLSLFLYLKTEEEFLKMLNNEFKNAIFCTYAYPNLHKEIAKKAGVKMLFLWPYKRGIGKVPWHSSKEPKNNAKFNNALKFIRKKVLSKALVPIYTLILTAEILTSPINSIILSSFAFNIYSAKKYSQRIEVEEKKEEIRREINNINEEIKKLMKRKEKSKDRIEVKKIEYEINHLMVEKKNHYTLLRFLEVIGESNNTGGK